jgi:hypothetical protein
MLTCPASWGEDGRRRAGCPDPAGFPGAGNGRARTGLCAPGRPTVGYGGERVGWVGPARAFTDTGSGAVAGYRVT